MTTLQRMSDERLEWWKKQQRSGKLGHNFECLIRDFQTERAVVEEAKAWLKFYESILRFEGLPKAADELHTILYPAPEQT